MSQDVAIQAETAGAPSANGELVFEEPWQGRVLSMAVHLSDCGEFAWDDFRARLIREIDECPEVPYFVQFLRALEQVLFIKGLLSEAQVSDRVQTMAQQHDAHHGKHH